MHEVGASNFFFSALGEEELKSLANVLDTVDVAPTILSPKAFDTEPSAVLHELTDRLPNLQCQSLQSLFFGVNGSLVQADELFSPLEHRFEKCVALGKALGVKFLILGSPSLRALPSAPAEQVLNRIAKLASMARKGGMRLLLEPAETSLGSDFVNTFYDQLDLHRAIGHHGLGIILDTANLLHSSLDIYQIISDHSSDIDHIHLCSDDYSMSVIELIDPVIMGQCISNAYEGVINIEIQNFDKTKFESLLGYMDAIKEA